MENQGRITQMVVKDPNLKPKPIFEPVSKSTFRWIVIIFSAMVLILMALVGFLFYQNQQLQSIIATYQTFPSPSPTITPITPSPSPSVEIVNPKSPLPYTCPANGWVDCMPGTSVKPECSKDALDWYKINCPDYKGVAY